MQHFCTYFDRNYLVRALVLHQSLVENSADFVLWALCLDEESERIVRSLEVPTLQAISLADLEAADPELAATKATRTRVEYYFTITPALPRYLLQLYPEVEIISYLDADLRFYADPELVFREMADGSVLIIPHGFAPHLAHLEVYGRFNVGMVSFRNDAAGMVCLERWRARCIEWCYDRVENGRFADQGYLDDWPVAHDRVVVVHTPGIGLGPWNASRFRIDTRQRPPTVDGHPLVFYHFQAFKGLNDWVFDDGLLMYGGLERAVRRFLYAGYVCDLGAAHKLLSLTDLGTAGSTRAGARVSLRDMLGLARRGRLLLRLGPLVIG